jgi:NCS1 family nucleobase:cation symporter-1
MQMTVETSAIDLERADRDDFLRVETHGIDRIPARERHGHPRELGFLWAGAFVNYASLFTASLLTTYYGLGVWDGLVAVIAGTIAGAIILGLLSNTGPRSGLAQIVFTRGIFGRRGSYIGAALTLFLALGWFAVDCVIAAQAGVQLTLLAGAGTAQAAQTLFPWVLGIATLSVVVAIFGHQTIKVFEAVGAISFAALSLLLFALLAPKFDWGAAHTVAGADYSGALVLGFMTCFALVASWYPFASDYSRYLPAQSRTGSVTLWPVLGVTLPMVLLGLFGLLLPTIDQRLAADPNGGVLAVITQHVPVAISLPFFAFVVLGEVWANYLDVYTAGLVAQSIGIRLKRWQTALGCGLLGAGLASYAVLVRDFHSAYQQFLILTYLWAPAWAAVVLLSFFVFARPRPRLALLAWALGAGMSFVFVNYQALFATTSRYFNQAVIDALHGADISGVVSVAVAAGAYALLCRRPTAEARD